jgi:hypothetical protein
MQAKAGGACVKTIFGFDEAYPSNPFISGRPAISSISSGWTFPGQAAVIDGSDL